MPARGGSKRIKNKNFKRFNGVPIIIQTLTNLKKTKFFDKIIVSTDHKKIENFSKRHGADLVIKREKHLTKDHIGTKEIISSTLKKNKLKIGISNYIFCIYPTSVFVKKKHLVKSLKLINKKKNDLIFSAIKYPHPIQRSIKLHKGKLKINNSSSMKKQTQKFNEDYYDVGQFYLAKPKKWLDKNSLFTTKSKFIEFFRNECTDIDNIEDWKLAEILFEKNKKKI
jgi:pseudaminic acid cytidylyltransferase